MGWNVKLLLIFETPLPSATFPAILHSPPLRMSLHFSRKPLHQTDTRDLKHVDPGPIETDIGAPLP